MCAVSCLTSNAGAGSDTRTEFPFGSWLSVQVAPPSKEVNVPM